MTTEDHTPRAFDMAALDAAIAAMTPAQREAELLAAEAVAVGLAAFELGEDAFARGDLTSARRWLTTAARHDAPGADRTLADVDVLINATRTPEAEQTAAGTPLQIDPDATEAERIDAAAALADVATTVREAEEQVHHAQEQAKRILDDAQTRADQILTEARHKVEAGHGPYAAAMRRLLRHRQVLGSTDTRSDLMLPLSIDDVPPPGMQGAKNTITGLWARRSVTRSPGLPSPYTGRWTRQATDACAVTDEEIAARAVLMAAAVFEDCSTAEFLAHAKGIQELLAHGAEDTTTAQPCFSEQMKALSVPMPWSENAADLASIIGIQMERSTSGILRMPSEQARLWWPCDSSEDSDRSRRFASNADHTVIEQPPAPAPRQEIVPGPRFREFLDRMSSQREPAVAVPAGQLSEQAGLCGVDA